MISIEGARSAGKTYFIQGLNGKFNFEQFPSDTENRLITANTPELKRDFNSIRHLERWFLNITLSKIMAAKKARNPLIVRDYLSLLAFSKAYEVITQVKTHDIFLDEIVTSDPQLPNLRLLITASLDTILKRESQRRNNGEVWLNRNFVSQLCLYYEEHQGQFGVPTLTLKGDWNVDDAPSIIGDQVLIFEGVPYMGKTSLANKFANSGYFTRTPELTELGITLPEFTLDYNRVLRDNEDIIKQDLERYGQVEGSAILDRWIFSTLAFAYARNALYGVDDGPQLRDILSGAIVKASPKIFFLDNSELDKRWDLMEADNPRKYVACFTRELSRDFYKLQNEYFRKIASKLNLDDKPNAVSIDLQRRITLADYVLH